MYKIIKDGTTLAMTEAPNYIKRQGNGCLALCAAEEAAGIAHAGTVYHLLGHPPLEGVETVVLEAADTGTMLVETRQATDDADALNVDQEYRLTILELGITNQAPTPEPAFENKGR
ncbi:MAG: hypothetical protein RR350_03080 [Oscillibacter sp.]